MVPDRNETANDADASPFSDNTGNPTPLAPVLLSVFTVMLGLGIIAPLLPVYARTLGADGLMLGMSAALLGTVVTTNLVLAAVLQLPMGMMADRFSRKGLLLAGTMLSSALFAAVPFATGAGFAAGPLLSGAIYQFAGIDPVFYACAGFLAAAVLFGFRFLDGHH